MKIYLTFTKKNLILLICTVLLFLLIAARISSVRALEQGPGGETNALRVEYAKSLGYTLDEDNVTNKAITIPIDFSNVYSHYNSLQNQAGFDLKPYAGCTVTVYSYPVITEESGDEMHMNLLVYDGIIIGGDICTARIDGYMLPLEKAS